MHDVDGVHELEQDFEAVLDSIGSLETRLNKKGDTGGGAAR